MRIAVFSDIHGNLPALQAVIADAKNPDACWCLGDVVGYGADPNACVRLVREFCQVVLVGNHDLGSIGLEDLRRFNSQASRCLHWTAAALEAELRDYLRGLATQPVQIVQERYTLVHASPRDPVWEYVEGGRQARTCFDFFSTRYCLFGHTHVPAAYDERGLECRGMLKTPGSERRDSRLMLNPGAVGQPRDGDWRASYLLIDEAQQRWEWRRVVYDVAEAAARIRRAGLPEMEAARLVMGR
ncbi:MAG TPA: metallophosphoesterase family protein [Chloroflexota bacterium]|jgi:diadenosine tetraphosphatase ApaH/serine/threonine PP2A family protein phosphatase